MASMICVSFWPALPTNGMPWMSSSRPGASPTNIKSAFGLPTPNTICLRPRLHSLHRDAVADVLADGGQVSRGVGCNLSRSLPSVARFPSALSASAREAQTRLLPKPFHAHFAEELQVLSQLIASRSPSGCRLRRRTGAQRDRLRSRSIDDPSRDRRLGLQWEKLFAVGRHQRDFVCIDLETGIAARDIVRDNQIDALSHVACVERRRHDIGRLGRKTHEQRPLLPGAQSTRDPRGCPACEPASA